MVTDEASKMVKWMIPAMAVILLVVLSFAVQYYYHPMPAQDCSKPYDYPICSRASLPAMHAQPSSIMVFLSVVLFIVIAVIAIYAGYHATVIEQATIITPTATIGKTEAKPAEQVLPPLAKPDKGVDPKAVK